MTRSQYRTNRNSPLSDMQGGPLLICKKKKTISWMLRELPSNQNAITSLFTLHTFSRSIQTTTSPQLDIAKVLSPSLCARAPGWEQLNTRSTQHLSQTSAAHCWASERLARFTALERIRRRRAVSSQRCAKTALHQTNRCAPQLSEGKDKLT